jgi:hypothetical protein
MIDRQDAGPTHTEVANSLSSPPVREYVTRITKMALRIPDFANRSATKWYLFYLKKATLAQ